MDFCIIIVLTKKDTYVGSLDRILGKKRVFYKCTKEYSKVSIMASTRSTIRVVGKKYFGKPNDM